MKIFLMPLLLIAFFPSAKCFAASSQTTNDIVAAWKIDWQATMNAMSTAEKQRFKSLPEDIRNRIQSSFTGRIFKFSSDGSVKVSWDSSNGSKTVSGTWQLSGQDLTLTVSGQKHRYAVTIEGNELEMQKQKGISGAIFSSLVLIKS